MSKRIRGNTSKKVIQEKEEKFKGVYSGSYKTVVLNQLRLKAQL